MEETRRRRRPLRALIGLLALAGAAATGSIAQALPGNTYDLPTVDPAERMPLLGCAAILALAGLWALGTSRAGRARKLSRRAAARRAAVPAPTGTDEVEHGEPSPPAEAVLPPWRQALHAELPIPAPPAAPWPDPVSPPTPPVVLHRLRRQGWYVADDVQLSRTSIDHVAVGPAGVLAVQVTSSDADDVSQLPLARARVAAEQFQRLLLARELDIEVVPAMVVWNPHLDPMPGGVVVVDSVAVLSGEQAEEWLAELAGKELLPPARIRSVRDVLADIVLGGMVDAPADGALTV